MRQEGVEMKGGRVEEKGMGSRDAEIKGSRGMRLRIHYQSGGNGRQTNEQTQDEGVQCTDSMREGVDRIFFFHNQDIAQLKEISY